MSIFLNPLSLRALFASEVAAEKSSAQIYELEAGLTYFSSKYGTIYVPSGFRTDFASVPRVAWSWMSPEDPCILYPSVVHDYGYSRQGRMPNGEVYTREQIDGWLREGMGACGARWDQQQIVFRAVRLFGGSHWNK